MALTPREIQMLARYLPGSGTGVDPNASPGTVQNKYGGDWRQMVPENVRGKFQEFMDTHGNPGSWGQYLNEYQGGGRNGAGDKIQTQDHTNRPLDINVNGGWGPDAYKPTGGSPIGTPTYNPNAPTGGKAPQTPTTGNPITNQPTPAPNTNPIVSKGFQSDPVGAGSTTGTGTLASPRPSYGPTLPNQGYEPSPSGGYNPSVRGGGGGGYVPPGMGYAGATATTAAANQTTKALEAGGGAVGRGGGVGSTAPNPVTDTSVGGGRNNGLPAATPQPITNPVAASWTSTDQMYQDYLKPFDTLSGSEVGIRPDQMPMSREAFNSLSDPEKFRLASSSGEVANFYRDANNNFVGYGNPSWAGGDFTPFIKDPSKIVRDQTGKFTISNDNIDWNKFAQAVEQSNKSGFFTGSSWQNILRGVTIVLGAAAAGGALGLGEAGTAGAAAGDVASTGYGLGGAAGEAGAVGGMGGMGGVAGGVTGTAGSALETLTTAAQGGVQSLTTAIGQLLPNVSIPTGMTASQLLGWARTALTVAGMVRGGGGGGTGGGGGGGGGGLGDWISGGVANYQANRNMSEYERTVREMIERGDPYGPHRADAIRRLGELESNPGALANHPLFKAMQEKSDMNLQRTLAARGYLGSGNEMGALHENFSANLNKFYGEEWNRIAKEAGVEMRPDTGSAINSAGRVYSERNQRDAGLQAFIQRNGGLDGVWRLVNDWLTGDGKEGMTESEFDSWWNDFVDSGGNVDDSYGTGGYDDPYGAT